MPYTHRRKWLLGCVALAAAAGCSAGHPNRGGAAPTLISRDDWVPPSVAGPPSTANFCTLLVADYEHQASLPQAKTLKVRQQIVSDFVKVAPSVVAAAPPSIAGPARLYFDNMASLLARLDAVGLDPRKLKPGTATVDLLSPEMSRATEAVTTFSQRYCHYTIGG